MPIRDRIREIKHLQILSVYQYCCRREKRLGIGVEKLYVIGNNSIVKDFETSRNHKGLTNTSVGANKWVFVKQFDTAADCIDHLRKDRYTIAATSSHTKGKESIRGNLHTKKTCRLVRQRVERYF